MDALFVVLNADDACSISSSSYFLQFITAHMRCQATVSNRKRFFEISFANSDTDRIDDLCVSKKF